MINSSEIDYFPYHFGFSVGSHGLETVCLRVEWDEENAYNME